jgi:general secretion pathway protein F
LGESTGNLVPALQELREFYRRKPIGPTPLAISIFIYQTGLFLFALPFFGAFLLPRFQRVLQDTGASVRDLHDQYGFLSVATFMMTLAMVAIGFLCLLGRGFWRRLYRRTGPLKALLDRVVFALPLVGPILRFEFCRQFASALSLLLKSGAPVEEAIRIFGELDLNEHARKRILRVRAGLLEGKRLSDLIAADPFFPSQLAWLIRAGESGGILPAGLREGAAACEGRARAALAALGRLALPAVIVINGILVLGVCHMVFGSLIRITEALVLW